MEKDLKQFTIGANVEYKYYDSERIHSGIVYEFNKIKLIKSNDEIHSPAIYTHTMEYCKLI